jgi:crotonobetainyl-CoA:carnitine CoA-transferase CaiB-like acyl-CoA transferase
VAEVEHPKFGTVLRHGPTVQLSETPCRIAPGCLNGQHTEHVLEGLGYASEEIAALKAKKVVFVRAELGG